MTCILAYTPAIPEAHAKALHAVARESCRAVALVQSRAELLGDATWLLICEHVKPATAERMKAMGGGK